MLRYIARFMALACVFTFCIGLSAAETAEKIRVGYFAFSSFHDKDSHGNLSGYGYEYLQEIAKYTRWEYEYVFATWDECLKMLADGKIDLLGSAQWTPERAKIFDFPALSSGISYVTLCVPQSNTTIAYEDFGAFNGLKVGLLRGNSRNDKLAEYCRENNFNINPVMYDDQMQMLDALKNGTVDAILTSNLRKSPGERIIARFAPSPFYFVTTKGNTKILRQLNYAQTQIKLVSPLFDDNMYQKYYASRETDSPVFTREERNYIKNAPTLRVVYAPDMEPIEYYDPNTGKFSGISARVFEIIADKTGLSFEFIKSESFLESLAMLKSGSADIISGVGKDYNWANTHGLLLSSVYINTPVTMVSNMDARGTPKAVAMTEGSTKYSDLAENLKPKQEIVYYRNAAACFEAVRTGKASATYVNAHIAGVLLRRHRYADLTVTTMAGSMDERCMAITKIHSRSLLGIINKSMQYISNDDMNKIIISSTMNRDNVTLVDLIYHNPLISLGTLALILFTVIFALSYIIISKHNSEKKIYELLYIDPLTGGWNMNKFILEAKAVMNTSRQYAVLYMDIDRFKFFNDTYGRAAADKILAGMANAFKESTGEHEIFARLAADNFVALLIHYDNESTSKRVEELSGLIEQHIRAEHQCYVISLIGGIYVLQPEDRDISFALDRANYARKSVKGMHRTTHAFYSDQIRAEILHEKEIEDVMINALAAGEFVPYFQPKFDLNTEKIVGAEALVRWIGPRGFVTPDKFIPVFEKNGFITEVDFYIYEQVCATLRSWIDDGKPTVRLSSNFSRMHLRRPDFSQKLLQISDKYGISRDMVELEITESAALENTDILIPLVAELVGYGFVVAMDDFGSGYSSLKLLKELRVNVLKLDKDFLQQSFSNQDEKDKERIIIEGFVGMAKQLNMQVVCEGVETRAQADFLRDAGCQIAQGYLYAKPMPLKDLEARLLLP